VQEASDRFDLVLSLEVAEHLPATARPSFVATLCSLGDVVLFFAAMPHQGGVNHINEAWSGYWNALFRKHGFECFDALRSAFSLRPDVERWYVQNALIFAWGQTQLRDTLAPAPELVLPYTWSAKASLAVPSRRAPSGGPRSVSAAETADRSPRPSTAVPAGGRRPAARGRRVPGPEKDTAPGPPGGPHSYTGGPGRPGSRVAWWLAAWEPVSIPVCPHSWVERDGDILN
jgi:hypothetical protein